MIVRRQLSRMLLFGSFFLGSFAFSQESINAEQINKDWTLFSTQNGLEIYIKKDECNVGAKDDFTYAQLKFVNTTQEDMTVDFMYELYHENGCVGCSGSDEYHNSVQVSANGSLEGDCSFVNPALSLLINNPYQIGLGKIQSIKVNIK